MKKYPVLPMWQPWASLCIINNPNTGKPWKTVETRSYPLPATLLEETVLIYACKKWDSKQENFARELSKIRDLDYGTYPLGKIIGSVKMLYSGKIIEKSGKFYLDGCYGEVDGTEKLLGDYRPGRYGWLMGDNSRLSYPIPFRCHQGINYFETDIDFDLPF